MGALNASTVDFSNTVWSSLHLGSRRASFPPEASLRSPVGVQVRDRRDMSQMPMRPRSTVLLGLLQRGGNLTVVGVFVLLEIAHHVLLSSALTGAVRIHWKSSRMNWTKEYKICMPSLENDPLGLSFSL